MGDESNAVPLGTAGHDGAAAAAAGPADAAAAYAVLRRLGAVGHQLRALMVAGDRFLTLDTRSDRDTATWLVSCAVVLSKEVCGELDGLARQWRQRAPEPGLANALPPLRTRAHQLHAAASAADHFLDEDNAEDRSTGGWLVACALNLADKLAGEVDDFASRVKRSGHEDMVQIESVEPGAAPLRRPFVRV